MNAVQGSMIGKIYHIMYIKEPDYMVLVMKTYEILDHL